MAITWVIVGYRKLLPAFPAQPYLTTTAILQRSAPPRYRAGLFASRVQGRQYNGLVSSFKSN